RLLRIFSLFPNISFVIKPPPFSSSRDLRRWFSIIGRPTNCRLIEGVPLQYLLSEMGGFIFDFPSTTFLETLLTEKPIFISVDPYLTHLEPQTEEIASKRAIICHGLEDFRTAFQKYL